VLFRAAASRASQLRRLGVRKIAVLIEAWLLLGLCWLALHRFGLVTVHRAAFGPKSRPVHAAEPDRIAELGRMVDIAARHHPAPTTCLTRSLVLGRLLRRRGVDAQLRIGVRLVEQQLSAHAWLECDGTPLNEHRAVIAQYAAFEQSLPPEAFRAA
jgi:hypothetical protein